MKFNKSISFHHVIHDFAQTPNDSRYQSPPQSPPMSDDELFARLAPLRAKARGASTGTIIGTVLLVICFLIFPLLAIICAIPLVIVGIQQAKATREIKVLLSENLVRGALAEMMELKTYLHDLAVKEADIRAADIITTWNRYSGSDYVNGNYRGMNITFSDVKLQHVTGSGKNRKTVTRFKGQWLICDLKREIKNTVKLREKVKGDGGKSDIETENIDFNNKFQICTYDPHTAFYILTPHFMEYINKADYRAGARSYFCFMKQGNQSQVHVALHNNTDLFEPKIKKNFTKEDLRTIREKIKTEIRYITGVIDELMLNDYLFGGN
ncbi:MAG: DUF3137 domain-containing protein [Oscillospiraceae bacterium]|nr:DUF3137 domain-containing protein [Oscillospiraceae bacterium]